MLNKCLKKHSVPRSAHQSCTVHVLHQFHSKTRPTEHLTQQTNQLPVSLSRFMSSCIVLTSLDASARQLQPLLAEAQARHLGRVYVTTSDLPELQITQQLINWLTELFNASAAVNPRLEVIPCLACAGWTTDKFGGLAALKLLISPSSLSRQAQQLQQQLNQHLVESHIQLHTVDADALAAAEEPPAAAGKAGEQQQQQLPELLFQHVAVGGTFDRLHAGHRLLLAATALVCSGSIYVGVTSDALLAKKSNKQLLQDYDTRQNAAVDFMVMVRPAVTVTAGALTDPAEPTQAELDPEMQALVVSRETLPGGEAINQGRIARGFKPLHLVVVGLIGGRDAGDKLSSTALRDNDAAAVGQQ